MPRYYITCTPYPSPPPLDLEGHGSKTCMATRGNGRRTLGVHFVCMVGADAALDAFV